ncbi:MAG: BrnT family toxin [Xanthobacteraceae bacterium]
MRWTWDSRKSAANRAKHGVSFETAVRVFDDLLHASKPDVYPDGERWHTLGLVGGVLLLVVHTWPEAVSAGGEPVGRIISARKATARERKAYEEGDF